MHGRSVTAALLMPLLALACDAPDPVAPRPSLDELRPRLHAGRDGEPRVVLVSTRSRGRFTARTIQEGIERVAAGGRVLVLPGTYTENVVIRKGVTLEALGGRRAPVVVAPDGLPVATIEIATPEPVVIRGLTVHARRSGISGISDLSEDLTVERTTVLAIDPPLGFAWLIDLVGDDVTATRPAKLVVRESVVDGGITGERTQTPPFPTVFGIRAGGFIDAHIADNVVRRTGGVCIMLVTRGDWGGRLEANVVRNVVDECHGARAGAIQVGPPIPPLPPAAITATGTVNLVGNTIRNSGGSCLTTSGIFWELFAGRIEHNRIEDVVQDCAAASDRARPAAIWVGSLRNVTTSAPIVRFNDIAGNAHAGLRMAGDIDAAVDARCNWWGSASGPSGAGTGSGDAVLVEDGAAMPTVLPFARRPIAGRHDTGCLHREDGS